MAQEQQSKGGRLQRERKWVARLPPTRRETSSSCPGMTTVGGWWRWMTVVGKEELVVVTIKGGNSLWGKGASEHFDFVTFRSYILRGEGKGVNSSSSPRPVYRQGVWGRALNHKSHVRLCRKWNNIGRHRERDRRVINSGFSGPS